MRILVVANWKMNPSSWREARALYEATRQAAARKERSYVIVAPPALYLRALAKNCRGRIAFAAQNAHFETRGAYTGELSMQQVREAGASYVLVGHAERRAMGETNEDIRKKIVAALSAKLTPILCIGETERKGGVYFEVIREQLRIALAGTGPHVNRVIIAYEPLWTIGKDRTMSPQAMQTMAIFIRKTVADFYGKSGLATKILYGGSVTEKDAPVMLRESEIRGFLVGRASTEPKEFAALLKSLES